MSSNSLKILSGLIREQGYDIEGVARAVSDNDRFLRRAPGLLAAAAVEDSMLPATISLGGRSSTYPAMN